MALQWSDSLASGIAEVDDQHRELFRRINNLLDASLQGRGREEIGRTINFLEEYVLDHFRTEERHMVRTAYPGYLVHKKAHAQFVSQLLEVKAAYTQSGATAPLVIHLQRTAAGWLREHIMKEDRALGQYLLAKAR